MDWFETTLRRLGAQLSNLLIPVAWGLERLHAAMRQQMEAVGVPFEWQRPVLNAFWALVLFMAVRSLSGWLRLLAVVFAAVVLAKVYGLLPGG